MTLHRMGLSVLMVLALAPGAIAQQDGDATALRERLRQRYDILALQNGVALVPRDRGAGVRIIEIRDGAVAIDGREVTGRELRDRLGADADAILRVSYLGVGEQRALAPPAPPAPPPPIPAGTPDIAAPSDVPASPDEPPPPDASRRPRRSRGGNQEIVRIGRSVTVEREEVVDGEVVVIMGSARIDGEVRGEVTVIMGSLDLGPESVVNGEVNVIGGSINRAPGARIDGEVHNVGIGPAVAFPGGNWHWWPMAMGMPWAWSLGGLAATLLRVTFMAFVALIVVAAGRNWIERIADHTAADPVRAGLVGFFAEVLFVPLLVITCIVLAVSIVGIPLLLLLPFVIVLLMITLVFGFTGVAYQVGRALNARFGWTGRSTYATVLVGVVVITALTLLARSAAVAGGGFIGLPLVALGWMVEYAAWTIGLGAALQVWRSSRRGVAPPPLPA